MRRFTDRLLTAILLSAVLFAVSGLGGSVAQSQIDTKPLAARDSSTSHVANATALLQGAPAQAEMPPSPPMRYVPGLVEPLVATGAVTPEESAQLDTALLAFHDEPAKARTNSDFDDYAKPLLAFVATHPQSNWNAALDLDIGLGYYQSGYYSRTFDYFTKSWQLGRNATSIEVKRMADRAMGELAEMHARLGHARELKAFFADVGDRPISGPATFMMQGAHDGLASFEHNPGVSYLCGPAALRNILLWLKAKPQQVKVADDARSGQHGFSLSELGALAQKAGLDYRLIYREPGQPVPVPSIINWSVHHYAAVLEVRDGRYRLQDPTFGGAGSIVTSKAADAEGSGYFLVPRTVFAAHSRIGWRVVPANSVEARSVYGMGVTYNTLPGCVTCQDNSTTPANAGSSPAPSLPMTLASAKMTTASLHLSDTPIGYRPQKGVPSLVTLSYNARDGDHPANFAFSNVSPQWTHTWQAYIKDDPNNAGSSVKRVIGGGGGYDYDILAQFAGQTVYNPTTGAFVPEVYDNSQLIRFPASGPVSSYVRNLPNGGKETYALSNGATTYPRIMFLTSVADPAGNTTTLKYDAQFRLTSFKDAMGRITTFTFGIASHPYLITKITDPFGRSSQLTYDTSERLASITDPVGIVSSFTYGNAGEPNFITRLTTPYGTSKFSDTLNPNDPDGGYQPVHLSLTMTDPLNNVEYLDLYQNQAVTGTGPEAVVPTGMTNDNTFLGWRSTYYWNAHEAANGNVTTDANGNPTAEKWPTADIYHWFHECCDINYVSNQLGSHKRPLEKYRQWYNVPQFNAAAAPYGYWSGTLMKPTAIGRVLDDGSTQLATSTYNSFGNLLTHIDGVGRSTQYTYAPNNIDLLTVQQLTAAPSTYTTVGTFGNYNTQHEPQTITGADGKTWKVTYNTAGQRTSLTDPNGFVTSFGYDTLSRLTSIVDANRKTVDTFTYDSADRIATHTDSEGYTLQYTYDNLDRVTKVTYPDGTSDTNAYAFQSGTSVGKESLDLRKHADRLGRVTNLSYDADRRLTSVTEPLSATTTRTTSYAYYEDGTLRAITDAKGNDTHWDIDLQSRPISKTYGYGTSYAHTETYTYEATASRLHSITDASHQVKTFSYDHNDNIVGIAYTNAGNATPNVTFSWDPYFPRMSAMTDGTGTTHYSYVSPGSNGALQVSSISGPFANDSQSFTYDALGRLAAKTIPGGNESFGYDAISRLKSHVTPLGTFAYTYLGETEQPLSRSVANASTPSVLRQGREETRSHVVGSIRSAAAPASGTTTVSTSWNYDTNAHDRRLIGITNSGITRSYTLGYTSGGVTNPYDIMSIIDTSAKGHPFASRSHTYAYDMSDRLATATSSSVGNYSYAYDPLDNATSITSTTGTIKPNYNVLNQVVSYGTNAYTYDANGNTLSDGTHSYKWDAENRLVEVDYVGSTNKSTFTYDALGHRRIETETSHGATTTAHYLWCGSTICQGRDGSNNVTRRLLDEGEANVTTGQKLVYMPDQLGSVRDVIDASSGSRVASYDYAPYGALARSSVTTGTDYQYAGLLSNPASGKDLSTYRPYDETTGRWLNRDPIRERAGTNLYAYAETKPTSYEDRLGLATSSSMYYGSYVYDTYSLFSQFGSALTNGSLSQFYVDNFLVSAGASGGFQLGSDLWFLYQQGALAQAFLSEGVLSELGMNAIAAGATGGLQAVVAGLGIALGYGIHYELENYLNKTYDACEVNGGYQRWLDDVLDVLSQPPITYPPGYIWTPW